MLEAEGMDLTDFVELSGDVAALDAVLPFDLFVDDAGRVRRVNLTIDLETLESMGAAELPPGASLMQPKWFHVLNPIGGVLPRPLSSASAPAATAAARRKAFIAVFDNMCSC